MEREKLIEKLENIEKKMLAAINSTKPLKDYTVDDKKLKDDLKKYIEKVRIMESLLDEYEEVVKEVGKLINNEKTEEMLAKMVVDMREDTQELKTLTEIINGEAVQKQIVKKKKKSSERIKEF